MSIKYLSPSGLTEVWSNIKTYIASKIPSKIITGLSIKGRTITYTNSDGTTGTLTTQDTNTTYSSMSTAEATTGTETTARSISAKVLHDKITSITNTKANDANVVHKSGDETIAGNKTFSNQISFPSAYLITTDTNDNSLRIIRHGTGHGNNYKVIIQGDTGKFFAPNGFIGNLQGNADTATSANDPNAVHKSGNETIAGLKTFNAWQIINYGLNVKWITGNKEQKSLHLFGSMNDKYEGFGSELKLYGDDANYGKFILVAQDKTKTNVKIFVGLPDGTLTWDGKKVLTAGNGVTVDTAQTIVGTKTFSNVIFSHKELRYQDTKYDWTNTSLNTWCDAGHVSWSDKTGNRRMHELVGTTGGVWRKACYINEKQYFNVDSNRNITYWGTTTFNGRIASHEVHATTANAFMAQCGSYTFLIRNDGNNTYFLMSDKDGVPGTWSTARPLIINNATGVCNINGYANTASYATTQATTDNSTKIATTAWVRTYVNSAVGSGSVGTTITAYWGSSSSTGDKWALVSNLNGTKRVSSTSDTFTPVVGQIYSGNQLYSTAKPSGGVGDTGALGVTPRAVYARLNLSGAFNSSYKYLCTTAVGVNATASVDVTGNTAYGSSGPHTAITGYSNFIQTVQGGKSTFLRVQ